MMYEFTLDRTIDSNPEESIAIGVFKIAAAAAVASAAAAD
jgi:hypothetical protein